MGPARARPGAGEAVVGLSHLTFMVSDLERATRLFVEVLGGQEVYSSGDRTFSRAREKFFLVGGQWIAAMLGRRKPVGSRSGSGAGYTHIAFFIRNEDLEAFRQRLQEAGFKVHPDRARVSGEGRSLYFEDGDDHLFELHTGTLEERLQTYRKAGGPT